MSVVEVWSWTSVVTWRR